MFYIHQLVKKYLTNKMEYRFHVHTSNSSKSVTLKNLSTSFFELSWNS